MEGIIWEIMSVKPYQKSINKNYLVFILTNYHHVCVLTLLSIQNWVQFYAISKVFEKVFAICAYMNDITPVSCWAKRCVTRGDTGRTTNYYC